MSTKPLQQLRPTSWLAERLGLSLATIEKLRSLHSPDLPPHITIGRSIRYEEAVVSAWLHERMRPTPLRIDPTASSAGGSDHE